MKSRSQKGEELAKGKVLLEKSQFLVFTDFTKVSAEDVRRLRSELRKVGAGFLVIKKRLLALLLKGNGADFDTRKNKLSLGTVFALDIEKTAGTVFKFFKELGVEKEKILGGYDLKQKTEMSSAAVLAIGQLPSREVLLGQLLGMIAAPIRSLLYVLDQKSKQSKTG